MRFETHFDRRIFKTIQGASSTNPRTLMAIIGGVDASERLVLTHEELSSGLQRLVTAGYIAEVEPHRFYDASSTEEQGRFSGITESDHAGAVQKYRDWFQRQLDGLDDDPGEEFVWRKVVLRLATPDDRWPTDDDEDRAEDLANVIDPIITRSGLGEINGFEHGSGQIDILIFGKATDSDVDRIYELLVTSFRAFKCSAGSRMIRVYNARNEELESDVVPDNAT